jgi:hypothetical protein
MRLSAKAGNDNSTVSSNANGQKSNRRMAQPQCLVAGPHRLERRIFQTLDY